MARGEERSTLYVRVPAAVYAELVRNARRRGNTLSGYVRGIIIDALERERRPGKGGTDVP